MRKYCPIIILLITNCAVFLYSKAIKKNDLNRTKTESIEPMLAVSAITDDLYSLINFDGNLKKSTQKKSSSKIITQDTLKVRTKNNFNNKYSSTLINTNGEIFEKNF